MHNQVVLSVSLLIDTVAAVQGTVLKVASAVQDMSLEAAYVVWGMILRVEEHSPVAAQLAAVVADILHYEANTQLINHLLNTNKHHSLILNKLQFLPEKQ